MKWAIAVVVTLVIVSLVVVGIGSLLPGAHIASRTTEVSAPPERVWSVITDVAAFPTWRPDVRAVEPLPSVNGRPVWREVTRDRPIAYETVESVPNQRLVTRIADRNLPFGGQWEIDLAPVAAGTRVTITERGEIYNPAFRFFARFVFGYTATIDGYLRALGRRVAVPPTTSSGPATTPPGPGANRGI